MSTKQRAEILRHLKNAGSITQREAMADYSIQSLTKRISELRKDGFNILGENKKHPTTGQRYKRYSMGRPDVFIIVDAEGSERGTSGPYESVEQAIKSANKEVHMSPKGFPNEYPFVVKNQRTGQVMHTWNLPSAPAPVVTGHGDGFVMYA